MKIPTDHVKRIRQELTAAGVTKYGLLKGESRKLPVLIHEDEHIHGAVYGHYENSSAMLVATDRRVIFIDWMPLFTTSDELSYDVVAGVSFGHQGLFGALTLHTRVGDYALRYVNLKCAHQFIKYIEGRRLEESSGGLAGKAKPADRVHAVNLDANARSFLQSHDIATFSTVDRTGNVHGAVVYYFPGDDNSVYILTKEQTQKAHNVFAHAQVALTIYDEPALQTLQLQGMATVEADIANRQHVFNQLAKPRQYGNEKRLPPMTQLQEGAFIVLKITPTIAKFTDFKQS